MPPVPVRISCVISRAISRVSAATAAETVVPRRRGADTAAASTRASAEIDARSPREIEEALRPRRRSPRQSAKEAAEPRAAAKERPACALRIAGLAPNGAHEGAPRREPARLPPPWFGLGSWLG